jgi:hypothetical protein
MRSDVNALINEVKVELYPMAMPASSHVIASDCSVVDCYGLLDDLEVFRGKPVSGDLIRLVHQRLLCLSPAGWRWVMPYYLIYCLSSEGQRNRFETEYLIYALSPSDEQHADVVGRLGLFDVAQLALVEKFLLYLASDPWWMSYCPLDLERAVNFIRVLVETRLADD